MKIKYFNRKNRRRQKGNLRKYSRAGKMFSKRMGGVLGVSVLMENRNITASDLSNTKKEMI